MKDKINYYLKNIKSMLKISKYHNRKGNINGLAAELIRNTHSIEKGLSIKNIKAGFGYKKITEMMIIIKQLEGISSTYSDETISMALSSLKEYIDYHNKIHFHDNFISNLETFISARENSINNDFGGTIEYNCNKNNLNINEIEKLFHTRHSIRNFSSKPVNNSIIKKAIELAHHCPSACNRQGVRCYIVDSSKAKSILDHPNGFQSFADNISKFIIITGKVSSYNYGEINQYIVSPSIFAGYLSLTLHLYGLGACIIQRPVIWNEQMEKLKQEYKIENDEQIICMIAVGTVEGIIKVPKSHKINIDEFAKFIN